MPESQIDIKTDIHGSDKEIKKVNTELGNMQAQAVEAPSKLSGLWKGIAAGILSYNILEKSIGRATDLLKSSVDAAADAEKANAGLDAALFTTGRTTAKLGEHFKNYADQLMRSTVYDDEAIKSAQAMLLQLTRLDKDGLDRATKGTIGLASVFKMDLVSAAELVGRWMDGNTDRIKRYGIHVDETASKEKQQTQILDQLATYYKRAEAETGTYSGRMDQLKNVYKEVQEKLGTAITQNETFQRTIKNIKEELQFFIDSGQAEKWAANISKAVSGAVKAVETFFAMIKEGPFGAAGKWSEEIAGGMDKWNKVARENVKTITEFRNNLKWVKPSLEDMRVEMEKGEKSWGEYRYRVATADAEFEKNKKTLGGWMDKAFGLIGIQTEIAKSFDKSTRGTGDFNEAIKALDKNAAKATASAGILAHAFIYLAVPALVETESKGRHMGMVLSQAVEQLGDQVTWTTKKIKADFSEVLQQVAAAVGDLFSAWSSLSQANADSEIANINRGYDERKQKILDSMMDEEEKAAAIKNLETEQNLAVRKIQREQAGTAKDFAIFEAIINTAQAVTKALTGAIPPWNFILAGLSAAAGAVQIAAIKAQPIPLAKGFEGMVRQPTLFLAGEAGPEHLSVRPGERGGGQNIRITLPVSVYIAGYKFEDKLIEIIGRISTSGRLKIAAKAIA